MAKYILKRKTFGFLGGITGYNNFANAAKLMTAGKAGAGNQLLKGGLKAGGLIGTAAIGKSVFDKMTGEG